jgi:hypothetical protein
MGWLNKLVYKHLIINRNNYKKEYNSKDNNLSKFKSEDKNSSKLDKYEIDQQNKLTKKQLTRKEILKKHTIYKNKNFKKSILSKIHLKRNKPERKVYSTKELWRKLQKRRKIYWWGIFILAGFIAIFLLLNFLNIAFFDFQCDTIGDKCSFCTTRKIFDPISSRKCEYSRLAEYYIDCRKNCQVRNFKCSFDIVKKDKCEDCLNNCVDNSKIEIYEIDSFYEKFENCISNCY